MQHSRAILALGLDACDELGKSQDLGNEGAGIRRAGVVGKRSRQKRVQLSAGGHRWLAVARRRPTSKFRLRSARACCAL